MSIPPKLRVFVVDDERVIAITLATILNKNGFEATAFSNAVEALLAAQLISPDLLISDVVTPEFSGVDLDIRVKALCPNCKVLLFSGQARSAHLLNKARALGHDFNLLSKPFHPDDLLKHIRTCGPLQSSTG